MQGGGEIMKRPHFKWCNHGCRARKAQGMATNGGCNFPPRLDQLKEEAGLFWSCHDDADVRRFARKVVGLLDHIYEEGD